MQKFNYGSFGMNQTGNWALVAQGLRDLDAISHITVHENTGNFAHAIADAARYAIYTKGRSIGQEWEGNAEETIRYKGFSYPYVYNMTFYEHITVFANGREMRRKVNGVRSRYTVFDITLPDEIYTESNKGKPRTYADIGTILEYGSARAHIPPRPLWGPLEGYSMRAFRHIIRRRKLVFFNFIDKFGQRFSLQDNVPYERYLR